LEALIVIALESYLAAVFVRYFDQFGGFDTPGAHRGVPVYFSIFILAQAFQIYLAWDSVIENAFIWLDFVTKCDAIDQFDSI
jgi:hypothetical protein